MIKFGPSGNSIAFSNAGLSGSEKSAKWVKDLGLDCFEYSFGRGVNMGDEKAMSLAEIFKEHGVEISVHAPYYINLATPEEDKAENSYRYILDSAKKLKLLGGNRVVFHPASQGKMKREDAVSLTEKRVKILAEKIYEEGLENLIFCPETMGKLGQIGTIEEIVRFCKVDKVFTPAVDFGHINAREFGSLKTTKDYLDRLNYMIDELGYDRVKNFHVHFSKIEYTAKGELRHLTFEDTHYGPEFYPLAVAIKELKLEPFIICESAGTQDIDAVKMKEIFKNA